MARKIVNPEEAVKSAANAPQNGVTFVKNQVNELIKFEDGTTYKFGASCVTVDNPELIEKLRSVADKYNIYEQ